MSKKATITVTIMKNDDDLVTGINLDMDASLTDQIIAASMLLESAHKDSSITEPEHKDKAVTDFIINAFNVAHIAVATMKAVGAKQDGKESK